MPSSYILGDESDTRGRQTNDHRDDNTIRDFEAAVLVAYKRPHNKQAAIRNRDKEQNFFRGV
jgi:hypothetical protein